MQRLAKSSHAFLSGAQRTEVLGSLRNHITEEAHCQAASWLTAHSNIEEDCTGDGGLSLSLVPGSLCLRL